MSPMHFGMLVTLTFMKQTHLTGLMIGGSSLDVISVAMLVYTMNINLDQHTGHVWLMEHGITMVQFAQNVSDK